MFDDYGIFGTTRSCRWITLYMICLSIYPRCDNTTQALIPPCMNDCLEYTAKCTVQVIAIEVFNINDNELDELLILNCSALFRAFDSVNVDTENCYNFSCEFTWIGLRIMLVIYN